MQYSRRSSRRLRTWRDAVVAERRHRPEGGSFLLIGSARTAPEEEQQMATEELTLDPPAPVEADVAASCGGARWSVAGCGWKKLLPDLPDDVITLLATPIVVSARALTGELTPTPGPHQKLTPTPGPHQELTPTPGPHQEPLSDNVRPPRGSGERTPRFLAPAAPRSQRARHRS
jgi:hypothetical protein